MIDGKEFLAFFGMIVLLGMMKSEEKPSLKKNFNTVKHEHQQNFSYGFAMGQHRFEAILDALKPNVKEFEILTKLQNKAFRSSYEPGSELSIDDGIIPYHMGYETKLRAAEKGRPAPVKHCPTKPHPYGFLTHQMVSKSAKTKLPYLYTYIPWLDAKVPLKEHESLRNMVLEWDRPYAFHFVGDSKFGTMEFFKWRKRFEYYGTFATARIHMQLVMECDGA